MTNRNLDIMPDLGPEWTEWTRDTNLKTPCFDTSDATYWLWVEEGGITLDGATLGDFIIEAPDWADLRAKAFEWLDANGVDLDRFLDGRYPGLVPMGELLNEVVAAHSGVAAKEAKAAAAAKQQIEVALRAFVDAADTTRFIPYNKVAPLIKSAEEALRGAP